MGWATFWAIFFQTHLVTLAGCSRQPFVRLDLFAKLSLCPANTMTLFHNLGQAYVGNFETFCFATSLRATNYDLGTNCDFKGLNEKFPTYLELLITSLLRGLSQNWASSKSEKESTIRTSISSRQYSDKFSSR
jgi:hypothetical protein